jgi:hypothetical protein
MNLVELQKKLMAAARADTPGDQVPYAFEKRIAARLADCGAPDTLALWGGGLWRAAVSCVAITLLFGAWAVLNPTTAATTGDLSQNFENTLLASVDQSDQAQ